MEKVRANFEEYAEKMEASLKDKVVIIPYIFKKNKPFPSVLDFGAGSGLLAKYLKDNTPVGKVYAVDSDALMRKRMENLDLDGVFSNIFECPKVDVIILNSVVHEIYSYADGGHLGKLIVLQEFFDTLSKYLNPKGRIIIREGFAEEQYEDREMSVVLKTLNFPIERYREEYGYHLPIYLDGNVLWGKKTAVKEFLNKFTWGTDSLDREINECINFMAPSDYGYMLEKTGFDFINFYPYCQYSYFYHLMQKVELTEFWDTHIIITAQKRGDSQKWEKWNL